MRTDCWGDANRLLETVTGIFHFVTHCRSYFSRGGSVAGDFPELVLLSGVESAPFHFWSLDLLDRRLTVHRRSQHLLAIDPAQVCLVP